MLPAFCTDILDKLYKNDILKMRKILDDSFYQHFIKFTINLHKDGEYWLPSPPVPLCSHIRKEHLINTDLFINSALCAISGQWAWRGIH